MAWSDLTPTQKQQVQEFARDYRAAVADTVRGLRRQQLLSMAYTNTISPLWAQIGNTDVIPDDSGLAGADHNMTKAAFTPKFTWTTNLLSGVYSDNGGAVATVWPDKETVDSYGVQLAGPANVG
ncbi:MAG: hypothetical protein IPL70_13260 [Uliginosibacterium sp.]|nr:hypothetical protein [Uliginosibacterium sp.]